jgi:hypothetical protein
MEEEAQEEEEEEACCCCCWSVMSVICGAFTFMGEEKKFGLKEVAWN